MSVKLRKVNAQIRDPNKNNQLVPFGLLGSDAVETIESAKTQALASIPNDYTTLANDVTKLKGEKIDKQQGSIYAGKSLVVGDDGVVGLGDVGMSENAKMALINTLNHVAWTDEHGASYVQALQNALFADSTESWDYEWNYLLGLPENHGMGIPSGGSVDAQTITVTAEGIKIPLSDTVNSIFRYYFPTDGYTGLRNYAVAETIFIVNQWGSYNSYPYFNGIRLTNGFAGVDGDFLPGAQLIFNQSGVSYYSPGLEPDASSHIYMLDSTPIELNMLYKVRCETENTTSGGVKSTESNVFLNGRFLGRIVNKGENTGAYQFITKRGATSIFKAARLRLG